jgi:hypothetical protein
MGSLVIGPFPGCRFARLYPAVTDRRRMRWAVERILDWDFDQIVVGHGAVVENNGKEGRAKSLALSGCWRAWCSFRGASWVRASGGRTHSKRDVDVIVPANDSCSVCLN